MTGLVAAALLACATAAGAGPGVEKVHLSRALGSPEAIVADGRSQLLLLGGYGEPTIRRIDDDGSLDRSFGDRGVVEMHYSPLNGVTVARDGKILVAGSGPSPADPADEDARLTRLLPNGRPDPSFGEGGTVAVDFGGRYDEGSVSAVLPGGDVLIAGARQTISELGYGNPLPAVARLRPDGGLDRSFGEDGVRVLRGGGESGALDVAPTPEGDIVVEGEADIGAAVWKLSGNGSVVRGFGKRGEVEIRGHGKRVKYGWKEEVELVDRVAVLPNGKLLLAGTGNLEKGERSPYRAVAVRLRRDGRIDRSYGTSGWAVAKVAGSTFVEGLGLLHGNVLLLGATAQYHHDRRSDVGAIAFGPSGRTDPRFGRGGRFRVDLGGWDEAESVTSRAGRAVILALAGKGRGQWLVTTPPLREP